MDHGDGSFGDGSFPSYPGDGSGYYGEGSDIAHDENNESVPLDSTNNVLIFVDAGGDKAPYYTFYDETKEVINDLRINTSKTYTFKRLDDASSHPFYISDNGHNNESSSKLVLSGDGSYDSGIKGSQSLVLKFVDADSLPDDYELSYYCTSHSYMVANFEITQDLNDEI